LKAKEDYMSECLDCLYEEHKEISCKCQCHWPTPTDVELKIRDDIFYQVSLYRDSRSERRISFECFNVTSANILTMVNYMFTSFKTFPVFTMSGGHGGSINIEIRY
jgi:hypothetical protein